MKSESLRCCFCTPTFKHDLNFMAERSHACSHPPRCSQLLDRDVLILRVSMSGNEQPGQMVRRNVLPVLQQAICSLTGCARSHCGIQCDHVNVGEARQHDRIIHDCFLSGDPCMYSGALDHILSADIPALSRLRRKQVHLITRLSILVGCERYFIPWEGKPLRYV